MFVEDSLLMNSQQNQRQLIQRLRAKTEQKLLQLPEVDFQGLILWIYLNNWITSFKQAEDSVQSSSHHNLLVFSSSNFTSWEQEVWTCEMSGWTQTDPHQNQDEFNVYESLRGDCMSVVWTPDARCRFYKQMFDHINFPINTQNVQRIEIK